MDQASQIPHLVKLLEDDSPTVRGHVVDRLMDFGPELEAIVDELRPSFTSQQCALIDPLMDRRRERAQFDAAWRAWRREPGEAAQLEQAMVLIARFQYGWAPPVRLGDLLDELANGFSAAGRPIDPLSLSRYLYVNRGYIGETEDYYSPLNSNLIHTIEQKRGIPIGLTILFMLVGKRLGLRIGGCNVPRHFLARAELDGRILYFDCYNRGRVLLEREVRLLRAALAPSLTHVLDEDATPAAIVTRVLGNLVHAYELAEAPERAKETRRLLITLDTPDALH